MDMTVIKKILESFLQWTVAIAEARSKTINRGMWY